MHVLGLRLGWLELWPRGFDLGLSFYLFIYFEFRFEFIINNFLIYKKIFYTHSFMFF
jgi:hypothetical protein